MKTYTVRMNGYKIADFTSQKEANNFVANFAYEQKMKQTQLNLIDMAVLLSDMKESKQVIEHIMEMR
jgi:hypothetical protein